MAVPDFQSIMLPLLQALADGQQQRTRDVMPKLASRFHLSEQDLQQLLPSGTQRVFENRVYWASSYLRHAGLIESPHRGVVRITDVGRKLLANPPERLSVGYLTQLPSFQPFGSQPALGQNSATGSSPNPVPPSDRTPEEELEATWQTIRDTLGQDLLTKIKSCSPSFFERLVVDLLVKMGYGGSVVDAGQTVGMSGDGGIDGIIKEDKLGLDVVYIQAKRWEAQVGRPVVQGFAGSLDGFRARKGVLITTSTFSTDATSYAKQIEKRIVLIEGTTLVRLMMEHGVGVTTSKSYDVQKVDLDYFDEEALSG
jgi:restriction system protein